MEAMEAIRARFEAIQEVIFMFDVQGDIRGDRVAMLLLISRETLFSLVREPMTAERVEKLHQHLHARIGLLYTEVQKRMLPELLASHDMAQAAGLLQMTTTQLRRFMPPTPSVIATDIETDKETAACYLRLKQLREKRLADTAGAAGQAQSNVHGRCFHSELMLPMLLEL